MDVSPGRKRRKAHGPAVDERQLHPTAVRDEDDPFGYCDLHFVL